MDYPNPARYPWPQFFARLFGFLALFAAMLIIYLSFALFDFLPPVYTDASHGITTAIYLLNFAGTALGVVLCPLFLPLPFRNKEKGERKEKGGLLFSVIFLIFAALPSMIIRSIGFEFWLASLPARIIQAINSGMFYPIAYGLFYLVWTRGSKDLPPPVSGKFRWMRQGKKLCFASFGMALALIGAVAARQYAAPLLALAGLADPGEAARFLFVMVKWVIAALTACAIACVVLIDRCKLLECGHAKDAERGDSARQDKSTDWSFLFRLTGLMAIFTMLNSLVSMRFFPLVSGVVGAYHFSLPLVAPAVLALSLLSGYAVIRFIRLFLFPAIVLFILLPCLPLFHNYPRFMLFMSSLVAVVHYTLWITGTTAVVETYRGRFWFYLCVVSVQSASFLSFLGPLFDPLMPGTPEMTVLIMAIAAAFFVVVSFRVLFPKAPSRYAPPPPPIDDIFRERGLTAQETNIARLIVTEGLDNPAVSARIFRSVATVETHVTRIYRKFNVHSRAEFIAQFVKKQEK